MKKLNKVMIVDCESTCWDGGIAPTGQLQREVSEIIEIGFSVVDLTNLIILYTESLIVKPTKTKITPYCTNLTTLTPEFVARAGMTFRQACNELIENHSSRRLVWLSWGDYDRSQFDRQCKRENVNYPFGSGHLNLKTLFSLLLGHKREYGLSRSLNILNFDFLGTHHRGSDDSINTANVLIHILSKTHKVFEETKK